VVLFFLSGGLLEPATLFYCYVMVGMAVSRSDLSEPGTASPGGAHDENRDEQARDE
jgi:hypothetical protein